MKSVRNDLGEVEVKYCFASHQLIYGYVAEVEVEYCFTSHQLIYGYVETEDDNDDAIDRNHDVHFQE